MSVFQILYKTVHAIVMGMANAYPESVIVFLATMEQTVQKVVISLLFTCNLLYSLF